MTVYSVNSEMHSDCIMRH